MQFPPSAGLRKIQFGSYATSLMGEVRDEGDDFSCSHHAFTLLPVPLNLRDLWLDTCEDAFRPSSSGGTEGLDLLAHLSLLVVKYVPRQQTKFARRTIPLRFGYAQQRFPVPEIICLAHEPDRQACNLTRPLDTRDTQGEQFDGVMLFGPRLQIGAQVYSLEHGPVDWGLLPKPSSQRPGDIPHKRPGLHLPICEHQGICLVQSSRGDRVEQPLQAQGDPRWITCCSWRGDPLLSAL
jgi:hypothetical protein